MSFILPVNPNQPDADAIAKAVNCLVSGGLVILPTETVYGIACDPKQPEALKRLQAAKGRDANKPIARLVASHAQVESLALHWNKGIEALCQTYWPGPLTLVIKTKMGWTGFRLPNHSIPIAVATAFGSSIALTSANLSGESDPRTADETNHLSADLTLDSGPTPNQAIPSTVIKIHSDHLESLREGALTFSTLVTVFNNGLTS